MIQNTGSPSCRPAAVSRWFAVSVVTLLAMLATAPLIARSGLALLSAEGTTPTDWVPADYGPRREYEQFTRLFGSGDVVVITWPGCDVDAVALERFAADVAAPTAPRDAAGDAWFETVATGRQALEKLTGPPLELDRDDALRRLTGLLVGPDRRSTCAVVGFAPAGLANRGRAVEWLRSAVARAAGVDAAAIHMAGSVTDNVAIDRESVASFRNFAVPAGLVVLAATWWSLRSLGHACLVWLVSLWCVGLSFFSLHAAGDRMSGVLIVMPVLVLVLGVSGGIHLVNYLVEELARGGRQGVAARALRTGWLPCALSAGTTAIGLVSLMVSELEPIRAFGCHAAVGVLAALVCTFLVVPGIFERFPARRAVAAADGRWQESLAGFVVRHATSIVAVVGIAMAVAAAGLPMLRTSVRIDTLFGADSPVIRGYAAIERAIGPLVPIEVLVRFAAGYDVRADERLDLVRSIERKLGGLEGVSGCLSAATFLPEMPAEGAVLSATRKVVAARRLERDLAAVDDMRYVRREPGGEAWRVTARVPALAAIDYGEFLDRVRREVGPVVAAAGGDARGISFACTGVMPLVHSIQNTLLTDLFLSFLSACGVITLVMIVVERGIGAGLLAMVGNVFPMLLMFGLLGWTRSPLDIGSVMTASIALGMAIDGTLHFLTFYRRERDAGGTPEEGVRAACRHSAGALAQTAVVTSLGILVFAASSFAPTSRFAWMLALLMLAALVGDLLLLPALLVGPLGRRFVPGREVRPGPGGSPTQPPACDR
jgi:predicted RND superfamily exporter protein